LARSLIHQTQPSIIGKADTLIGRFYVYWDPDNNESFIDGADWHVRGVTKMMTLEFGTDVKIEKVVMVGDEKFGANEPIVSFKDPTSGKVCKARISFLFLKNSHSLHKSWPYLKK